MKCEAHMKCGASQQRHESTSTDYSSDQFPRNFPVACYEEVGDVANKSARKLRGNWSQWNLSLTMHIKRQSC